MDTPDVLNSKIKKIRIELPHYSFSHSSSGDSPHAFIGRERIREKLKKVLEDSPDEPGVYLIAGNRGVGKTSLVNEVIKETSLQSKTKFTENLRYLILLFFVVTGIQFCLQKFQQFVEFTETFWFWIVLFILFVPSFILLCCINNYRHKISKQTHGIWGKIWNCIKSVFNGITSAIKELSYLINPHNPNGKTQYVLKIILVACYTQIISRIQFCSYFPFIKTIGENQITPTKAFVFYLCFIYVFMFWRFVRGKLHEYYRKYKKDKRDEASDDSIYDIENKGFLRLTNCIFKYYSTLMLLILPLWKNFITHSNIDKILIILISFITVFIFIVIWRCKYLDRSIFIKIMFHDLILAPIKNYIKNHSRLYLHINFGHRLKDEKDILRLITRTLSTEYNIYRRSFLRMLPWRILALSFLLLFACLFSPIIEKQEFYKKLIKENELYEASSQILFEYPTLEKDGERLEDVFSKVETLVVTNVVETWEDIEYEISSKRTRLKPKVDTKVGKVGNFLLTFDQLIFEITKIIKKSPQYFWEGKKDFNDDFYLPINYLFWLSFFSMYLFCVLLFHCTWITHFFVTHSIIKWRLKKLNNDIIHNTERENSINIKGLNKIPEIGTKTIKSRDIADAREIEKELQDILNDMKRIPLLMCCPNIVIVFDELDKVEPGDAGLEKENLQTKASLFSIGATRERQTEILRILSNMKYFLSTAKAKFIFITGREMFDIHLADVSERNNYIGSIFNVVILVPSFLTDHHTGKKFIPQESSIASLPEEFVCRKLIPYDYPVESYDLKNYRIYLEKEIFCEDTQNNRQKEDTRQERIQKTIAVLQQFIIYLAHVSKGAPKKMMQLFESFVEIRTERDDIKNTLLIQHYYSSRHFLSFNYYKQYTLGIIAYLITPIFYRLAESNIKEHSDKLLVSSLRFVDFLFKFHKHSFSWKILDISPEMLEVNRAPELKSVAVDLLNYLAQIHINKSNFSLSDYKFDSWIANGIFAMTKTDEVFSALFSFSLDEMLPLKKQYLDLLENTKKEYQNDKNSSVFIDAISSLQVVLGDLCYYNDELEEAEVYYKSTVQALRTLGQKNGSKAEKDDGKINQEHFYVYVRNMLRLGMIYEKRKQYDFAYQIYVELCDRNINITTLIEQIGKIFTNNNNDMPFEKTAYEGLKMLYLPFIAKFQILEKSHIGGIASNHLKQLDKEFENLTKNINHEGAQLLEAEFLSRVADILYYKNSDLNNKKDKRNSSCTACDYYLNALSTLLEKSDKSTIMELLYESIEQINGNYNMKYCTILARILSDWGNVFFSCDINTKENGYNNEENICRICAKKDFNTKLKKSSDDFLNNCIKYLKSEKENGESLSLEINRLETKKDIALAMYSISSVTYRKASLYKRSAYQIYKMLCLFKDYEIYQCEKSKGYIKQLGEQAIHYLWYANDDLNVLDLNKRKKDFNKNKIEEIIPLQNLLVDSEITKIKILIKEMELKSELNKTIKEPKDLKKYYNMRITSPYKIVYSIGARIYQLRLKSKVNYEAYQQLLEKLGISKSELIKKDFIPKKNDFNNIFEKKDNNEIAKEIFGEYFDNIQIFENLIAESIYCLIDIAQLSETMDETYLFPHNFIGTVHEHLSFWIRQYEAYEIFMEEEDFEKYKHFSHIKEYLKQYLDEEWREQLSGYRENQRALSHYYKSLEMHNEGRAYHNMIDTMCYVKDDFNDRSDHFNIAEERHLIVNGEIERKINAIKDIYKESKLYKVENYFEKI